MIREFDNYSLLQHNTFGIDVKATHFIEYESIDDLKKILSGGGTDRCFLHIGGGSNLLFMDDYDGTVLHSAIKGIHIIQETPDSMVLQVGAGVVWDDFVAYCVNHNLYGAENLSGIPGEVGAGAVQNIGAYGVEVKDIISSVSTIDINGNEKIYRSEECEFSYRHSVFKKPEMSNIFVTYVNFTLNKKPCYTLDYGTIREELNKYPEITLERVRQTIINIRTAKLPDPNISGNAGSFFMNPVIPKQFLEKIQELYPEIPYYETIEDRVKIPAAWLIEQTGWKGRSLGPAAVYNKQALILINNGGATGKDIMNLSAAVQKAVKDKFDIDIVPEVKMIF